MKSEKRDKKSLLKNVRAVSPVIGVILMVAVTVIMAAIIMSWSSGIKAPEIPRQCSVTVNRIDANNISITVTSREPTGEYIDFISYTGTNPADNTPIINAEVMSKSVASGGDENTVLVGQLNSSVPHKRGEHLVVTCTWSRDGKVTVLYDARI